VLNINPNNQYNKLLQWLLFLACLNSWLNFRYISNHHSGYISAWEFTQISFRWSSTRETRYDYNLTIMKSPKPTTDTIYPHIKFWWYRTMLNFTAHFYAVFWQPFWKWQTSWKFWKRRIAPLMVTYHYVKIYVSIIIQLEVININVRNFKFPIGFYSNPHPLWTPKYMALTPFTTNLKTLGSTRNIYL
jgi:hypothetical protein